MMKKLIMIFIALNVVVPSYGLKFRVINLLNTTIRVEVSAGSKPKTRWLKPREFETLKDLTCLSWVRLQKKGEDDWQTVVWGRALPYAAAGAPGLALATADAFCKDSDMEIMHFKGAIPFRFSLHDYGSVKVKYTPMKAHVVHLGLTPKKIVEKITESKVFSDNKNLFFNANEPKSIQLGTLHLNLPKACEYNLDKLLLKVHESPIATAKKLKEPSFFKLMDKNKLIFKSNKPQKCPAVNIEADKKDNQIIITSKTADGTIRKSWIIHPHKLADYLKKKVKAIVDNQGYVFFSGFPLFVTLNLTIDKDGVHVDGLNIHALYHKFWRVVHGKYKRPPRSDYNSEIGRTELIVNQILMGR